LHQVGTSSLLVYDHFLYQMSHACLQCFINVLLFVAIKLKIKEKIYSTAVLLFPITYYKNVITVTV